MWKIDLEAAEENSDPANTSYRHIPIRDSDGLPRFIIVLDFDDADTDKVGDPNSDVGVRIYTANEEGLTGYCLSTLNLGREIALAKKVVEADKQREEAEAAD